jgi:hypothetical protein
MSSTAKNEQILNNDGFIDRDSFEFPWLVRSEALRRNGYCCERCGRSRKELRQDHESTRFEFHHFLGIWEAMIACPEILGDIAVDIVDIVRSLANIEVLCVSCHKKAEGQRNGTTQLKDIAVYVVHEYQRLYPSRTVA